MTMTMTRRWRWRWRYRIFPGDKQGGNLPIFFFRERAKGARTTRKKSDRLKNKSPFLPFPFFSEFFQRPGEWRTTSHLGGMYVKRENKKLFFCLTKQQKSPNPQQCNRSTPRKTNSLFVFFFLTFSRQSRQRQWQNREPSGKRSYEKSKNVYIFLVRHTSLDF